MRGKNNFTTVHQPAITSLIKRITYGP